MSSFDRVNFDTACGLCIEVVDDGLLGLGRNDLILFAQDVTYGNFLVASKIQRFLEARIGMVDQLLS